MHTCVHFCTRWLQTHENPQPQILSNIYIVFSNPGTIVLLKIAAPIDRSIISSPINPSSVPTMIPTSTYPLIYLCLYMHIKYRRVHLAKHGTPEYASNLRPTGSTASTGYFAPQSRVSQYFMSQSPSIYRMVIYNTARGVPPGFHQ